MHYFDVVAIASSAGGYEPLIKIISGLPSGFPTSIIVVQHMEPGREGMLVKILSEHTSMRVKVAEDKEKLSASIVYIANPRRQLMVNSDRTFSYGTAERIHFVKPAADVVFITMAISYKERAIGVILSGLSQDGAVGAIAINKLGGKVIAQQDPKNPSMPESAIEFDDVNYIAPMDKIAPLLMDLVTKGEAVTSSRHPDLKEPEASG